MCAAWWNRWSLRRSDVSPTSDRPDRSGDRESQLNFRRRCNCPRRDQEGDPERRPLRYRDRGRAAGRGDKRDVAEHAAHGGGSCQPWLTGVNQGDIHAGPLGRRSFPAIRGRKAFAGHRALRGRPCQLASRKNRRHRRWTLGRALADSNDLVRISTDMEINGNVKPEGLSIARRIFVTIPSNGSEGNVFTGCVYDTVAFRQGQPASLRSARSGCVARRVVDGRPQH